jgi:decaprenyl-phosphate phosphoribosyltransferase
MKKETMSNNDKAVGKLRDYVHIARPDHWIKHIFIIPGIVLSIVLLDQATMVIEPLRIVFGFASACLIASANYTINEWLDAEFDQYHPLKKDRAAVKSQLEKKFVLLQYFLLTVAGFYLAYGVGVAFMATIILFWISGVMYNVRPFRTKDRPYLDVISESLNNPIRLLLGWFMISGDHFLPPSSVTASYWMGGAFLMTLKRFAEYRTVSAMGMLDNLHAYRPTFKKYSENSLLISAHFYAILSAFLLGIFLVKHRIEYIILFPMLSLLFSIYLNISLKEFSTVQKPEKLHREPMLVAIVIVICLSFVILSFIDLPFLKHFLIDKSYYRTS